MDIQLWDKSTNDAATR